MPYLDCKDKNWPISKICCSLKNPLQRYDFLMKIYLV